MLLFLKPAPDDDVVVDVAPGGSWMRHDVLPIFQL